MDFSVAGSDAWGSSLSEEAFIKNYFSASYHQDQLKINKEKSQFKLTKTKLKDKIYQSEVPKQSKNKLSHSSSTLRGSSFTVKELDSELSAKPILLKKFCDANMSGKSDVNEGKQSLVSLDVNIHDKSKESKRIQKSKESLKRVESSQFSSNDSSKIGKKNSKKLHESLKHEIYSNGTSSNKDDNFSKAESLGKRKISLPDEASKKFQKTKQASVVEDTVTKNASPYNSCDSEESDTEILRNEVKNSKVYRKIQELLEKSPQLCSSYSKSGDSVPVDSVKSNSSTGDHDGSRQETSPVVQDDPFGKNQSPSLTKRNISSNNKKELQDVVADEGFKRSKIKKSAKEGIKVKAQEKLRGAKFRFLNEKLYTETGSRAFQYFQENKKEFEDYHLGYTTQVSKWPLNPVDQMIADLQKMEESIVIADMGCGEAAIAQTFSNRHVFSFDLVAMNKHVTACDFSKVPLAKETVDVAVFCLSLMGTNLKDYLCEAFRVLKVNGILKIAEVESRIEDLDGFIEKIEKIGFSLEKKNTKQKIFIFLDFKKEKKKLKLNKVASISLKPCLYKKR